LNGASVVQRGKRFTVVAYAGIDPENKKQRYKWFGGFATRKEAEQFRINLAHHPTFSAGQGPYGNPRLRTGDYLDAYLESRRKLGTMRDHVVDHSKMLAKLYLRPTLGHIPLSRLSPLAIQYTYELLLDRGLGAATIVRAAGLLHAALNGTVHQGLIGRNPQDNTTLPRVRRYEPTVLTPEQIVLYLNDARVTATPALVALYTVAVSTGARIGELLGLPEAAADIDSSCLRISQDLVRAGADPVYGQPKTTSGHRTILLAAGAVEVIREALWWKKEQRMKLGRTYRDAGLLFCGQKGRPLNPSNIRNRDHLPRLERLGLPRTRPYDLRHFHATFLVAEGIDYRTVGDRLGHKSASFTLSRYVHASAKGQQRAADAANDLLMKIARVQA